jgi:hypothetical protein
MQLSNLLRGSPAAVMEKNSSVDEVMVKRQPADCSRNREAPVNRQGIQGQFSLENGQFFNDQ